MLTRAVVFRSKAFGTLGAIRQRPEFKEVVDALARYAEARSGRHPKLVALENTIIQHFRKHSHNSAAAGSALGSGGAGRDREGGTRVMVFASGRDWVEEIVRRLDSSGDCVVKPAAFIGQV